MGNIFKIGDYKLTLIATFEEFGQTDEGKSPPTVYYTTLADDTGEQVSSPYFDKPSGALKWALNFLGA